MIDSFVLMTPLLLLPIILLFAFIGCGKDFAYGSPNVPVTFRYDKGLAFTSLNVQWGGPFASMLNGVQLGEIGKNPDGEEFTVGSIPLPNSGNLICLCTVFVNDEDKSPDPGKGEKKEDEDPPKFVLKSFGTKFFVDVE